MSMISAQIDELRRMADGQATYRDAREVMLKAADTITELRGALHVASVDYRHLNDENTKLRELVLDYFNAPCLECNPWAEGWEGCKHCESGNCALAVRTLELGIEVDG